MRITSLIILPNQREYIQSIFPLKYGRKQNYFAKRFNSYTLKGGRPGLKSILLVYRKCYFHFYNFYVLFTTLTYCFQISHRNGNVYAKFLHEKDATFSQKRVLGCDGCSLAIAFYLNFAGRYIQDDFHVKQILKVLRSPSLMFDVEDGLR